MVFIMVAIGGYTRLTNSGLSIVEWKPVTGAIPPLSNEEWVGELEKYKESPEYNKINFGMTLEEFKEIYLVEYVHRLLGRITGFVFFIPFLYFLITKNLNRTLVTRLSGIFILGALQGAVGWYMVKSGLVDRPDVSHYRLTVHLLFAFLIYSLLFWSALENWYYGHKKEIYSPVIRNISLTITGLIFLQVAFGGLVAGLDAGLMYNTFPLMDGQLIPEGILSLSPVMSNFTENAITVQFTHRLIALVLLSFIIIFWIKIRLHETNSRIKFNSNILMVVICMQVALGICTLIYAVPMVVALVHQGFALVLLSTSMVVNYKICGKVA